MAGRRKGFMHSEKIYKWYVYELIDPRDNRVFYVGKGTGERINAHEREARSSKYCNQAKVDKIRSIWADGLQVIKEKVAYFWDEVDSYKFESERITTYKSLTNNKKWSGKRKYSFFDLVFKIIKKRASGDIERLKRLFPRHLLPTKEHQQLFDIATYYD